MTTHTVKVKKSMFKALAEDRLRFITCTDLVQVGDLIEVAEVASESLIDGRITFQATFVVYGNSFGMRDHWVAVSLAKV